MYIYFVKNLEYLTKMMYFCEDLLSMTYQELIAERDWLKKRVRELEEENLKLKEILGYTTQVNTHIFNELQKQNALIGNFFIF